MMPIAHSQIFAANPGSYHFANSNSKQGYLFSNLDDRKLTLPNGTAPSCTRQEQPEPDFGRRHVSQRKVDLLSFWVIPVMLCWILLPSATQAAPTQANLDVITFGDASSETGHNLTTGFHSIMATVAPLPSDTPDMRASDIVTGLLSQKARRLLPRVPNSDYFGGQVLFSMAVDPTQQNHFTLKHAGASEQWLVLEIDGREVGGRGTTGEESVLLNGNNWLPGAFGYRTLRLPMSITTGKSKVTVKIRSLGRIFPYAGEYDRYQKRMNGPSVELYRAYTHIGTQPDISKEPQATPVAGKIKPPATAGEEQEWRAKWKKAVDDALQGRLNKPASALTADDLSFLAQGYKADMTVLYGQSQVVSQVRAGMDALVSAYSANPSGYFSQKFMDLGGNGQWGGYLGQAGYAIVQLWPQLTAGMGDKVGFGGSLGLTTRAEAWAMALRGSVDFGRMNRRGIANQGMVCSTQIYWANAALLLVAPHQALLETEARRYLYEDYGIAPWLGSDQPGGGAVPVRGIAPNGPNWFMVTSRGTTWEGGLVGGDYGERGPEAYVLGCEINDNALKAQGLKMMRARLPLRYPAIDANGYIYSTVAEPVGVRNDMNLGRFRTYLAHAAGAVAVAADGAAVIGKDLTGAAQQQFNEGQLLSELKPGRGAGWMQGGAAWGRIVHLLGEYNAFRAQPQTGVVLPMTAGQPDFAWADEENTVVAAKHGDERIFFNLRWRSSEGILSLARVFWLRPNQAWIGDVHIDQLQFRPSGGTVTLRGSVGGTRSQQPLDKPVNANLGLVLPQALRPDLTTVPPKNTGAGAGTAYVLRYGDWLVAMNAHPIEKYEVMLPPEFGSGRDLVSGATIQGQLLLAPKTTAVFYMPDVRPPTAPTLPPAVAVAARPEGPTCALPDGATATVWFGAGNTWVKKTGVTGTVTFDAASVGIDPTLKGLSCRYVVTSTVVPGKGNGLVGSYYATADLSGKPEIIRTEVPWFDWGTSAPAATLKADSFSVRWTGQVQAREAGDYQFRIKADNGVRVWINGALAIENPKPRQATEKTSPSVKLASGQKVAIVIEYLKNTRYGTVQLSWLRPGGSWQPIPISQLYRELPDASKAKESIAKPTGG